MIANFNRLLAGTALCVFGFAAPAWANDEASQPSTTETAQASPEGDEILVTAVRNNRISKGATNLPLSIVDTPQSVTVVTRDTMDDFAQDDVNEVLRFVTGVNVETAESDRTYYNSRGFDIKSMQVDGQGLPFKWNVVGPLDTFIYEKVEVVRGANGLLTGTGNPSGTINYVRKRPLNGRVFSGELSVGTFGYKRAETDLNMPLDAAGNWTLRVVGAHQDSNSYLRDYETRRTIGQAILEGQVGPNTVLSAGYVQQNSKSQGLLWGALPLLDSNGNQVEYDRGDSTTMDWSFQKTRSRTAFAEVVQQLGAEWQAKAIATWNDYREPSELFYVYGRPDPVTGEGLFGWPGSYLQKSKRRMLDVSLTGKFNLLGQQHDLVVGANAAASETDWFTYHAPADDPVWGALTGFPDWRGDEIARPEFDRANPEHSADYDDTMKRLYGAARASVTDRWKLIAGFNAVDVKTKGFAFGASSRRKESAVAPYVGTTFELLPSLNLYASYSDIFEPQQEIDENLQPLGSAEGKSYEVGIKGDIIPERLFASLAWFRADQDNIADYAGFDLASGQSYYRGIHVESRGIEAELGGRITPWFKVQGGFIHIKLDDGEGNRVRTYVPRNSANLGFTVEAMDRLEFGLIGRWQDEVSYDTGDGVIRQGAYATVNGFARAKLSELLELGVNITNLTNRKYLTSLYWDQSFYAAPRSISASLKVRY